MKPVFLLLLTAFIASTSFSQSLNPVSWSFSSKKITDKEYELQLVATIQPGWHLYSQSQPDDAIAIPTAFSFNKNPLVLLAGKVKEAGKLEKFVDKDLGVSANQYSNKVVFTQRVQKRGKVKTAVTGVVVFQTCDDKKCLPPKTVNFTVSI